MNLDKLTYAGNPRNLETIVNDRRYDPDSEREGRQAAAGLRRRQNVRDWLYVEGHCDAIATVLAQGRIGESYNIGGWNEKTNKYDVAY